MLAIYKECPNNSPVENEERYPYGGLVQELHFPRRTQKSGYEEEIWRQEQEWGRKYWGRLFGEDEEMGENYVEGRKKALRNQKGSRRPGAGVGGGWQEAEKKLNKNL